MLQTQAKVWKCTRLTFRMLLSTSRGTPGRGKDFYITGDLNVELGLMCTDENDIEKLTGIYGPLLAEVRQRSEKENTLLRTGT